MRRISFLAIAVVVAAVSSCLKYEDSPLSDSDLGGVRLTGYTESRDTRSAVVDGGTTVYWEKEDEIKVFSGESSARFVSCNSTLDVTAEFEGPSGFSIKAGEGIAAVYPYSEDAVWDGETFTLTLPSEQVACAGTFARGMNIAVAKSEDNSTLQFRNVGGGVRFSVKEEGVKKVIFEGLDGEAIAGKVKIGFEAGIPVVKEVTEARQFITLTAPDGKAFEVGKWYYIVAIPGALDKGFKLRFYKDDTYARLTTEKSVQVKRSVFGSVADADEGVEYEAVTTHFPVTDEENEESIKLSQSIATNVSHIIELSRDNNTIDEAELLREICGVEGVNSAELSEDKNVIYIMQNDSTYINAVLNDKYYSSSISNSTSPNLPEINLIATPPRTKSIIPTGKKALLIAPFHSRFYKPDDDKGWNIQIDILSEVLANCGYELFPICDYDVTLDSFRGDNLAKYDLILIYTHGIARVKTRQGELTTALETGAEINACYSNSSDIALTLTEDSFNHQVTVPWLNATTSVKYHNAIVYVGACESYMDDDLANYFLDHNASAYGGMRNSMMIPLINDVSYGIVLDMSLGIDFYNASEWIRHSPAIREIADYCYNENPNFPSTAYQPSTYKYTYSPQSFLFDPAPYNLKSSVSGNEVTFTWESDINPKYKQFYSYSIFVDGEAIKTVSEKICKLTVPEPDEHTWFIRTNINADMTPSYQSGEESFTIEGQTGGGETMLNSRTYGGKTYSIIRKNESKTDYRVNGDGSKFYKNSFSVKVDNTTYDIPGTYYSYETDRNSKDLGPALAVNKTTGDMWLFLIEKDVDEYYGMCGYIIKISKGSYSKTTVFTQANFGWFPFFGHQDGSLVLNCFSYAGYFSLISFEDEDWALYMWYDIMPDDFKALQDQNEIIYIF